MTSLEAWRAQGKKEQFDGHKVVVYDGGDPDGVPMLLIHGFPTAAWDWHKIWPTLGQKYRLVAPDLLGFGFSDKPRDYPYSFRKQADLCAAAMAARGCHSYHVLSHDYGDTVAQELLARQIESANDSGPRSTCLLNGGIFPDRQQPILMQRLLAGPAGPLLSRLLTKKMGIRSLSRVFGADTQPTKDEADAYWQLMSHDDGHRIIHKILAYLQERRDNQERWVGALAGSRVPLLLIDGLLDPVSGSNMTTRWRELLPDAGLVELPHIGHYPQMEAPGEVLDACLPFFEGK